MKKTLCLLASLAIAGLAGAADAQYPTKPVRVIVPLPPGGASDAVARTLAQGLTRTLGQPIVVENKPGAGGALGAQALLAAPADGHTLLWGIASMTAIPLLQRNSPFGSLADLTPVSNIGSFPFGLFVHPSVPARSVAELVTYAKAHPDKLAYASGTLGEFMAAAQFANASGTSMLRVPYKGGAQVIPDLLQNRVQVYFTPVGPALPHVRDGKLRVLGILEPRRIEAAPEVPTMAEAGQPGVAVPTWQALFAAPRTAPDLAARVSDAVRAALQDTDVRAGLARQSFLPVGSTPEALAATVAREIPLWRDFIRDNGVQE